MGCSESKEDLLLQERYRILLRNPNVVAALKSLQLDVRDVGLRLFRVFAAMDVNASNSIDLDELHAFFGLRRTILSDQVFSALGRQATSREVTFDDFVYNIWSLCTMGVDDVYTHVFEIYDLDHGGTLDAAECDSLFRLLYNTTELRSDVKKIIQEVDGNGDGQLSKDEFSMLCSKHRHLLQPIFTMQSKVQEKCLGKAFWTKQRQKRPKLLAGRDNVLDLAKPQTIAPHVAPSNATPKAPELPQKQAWTESQVSTSKPTATEKLAAKQKQHEQEVLEAWITTQTQLQPLVQLYFEAYAEKHTVDTNLRTYLASGKGKSQSPEDVQTLTDLRYQAAVWNKKYNVAKAKLHEVWDAEEQAETEKRHHAVRGVVHGVSSKTLHKQTGKQSAQSVIGSYMDKKLDAATQEIHQVFQQRWETLVKAAQYVTTTRTPRDKPLLRPSVSNGTNRVVPVLQETEAWTEHFDTTHNRAYYVSSRGVSSWEPPTPGKA